MSLCRGGDYVTQVDGVSIYKDDNHLAASQVGIVQENLQGALQNLFVDPVIECWSTLNGLS